MSSDSDSDALHFLPKFRSLSATRNPRSRKTLSQGENIPAASQKQSANPRCKFTFGNNSQTSSNKTDTSTSAVTPPVLPSNKMGSKSDAKPKSELSALNSSDCDVLKKATKCMNTLEGVSAGLTTLLAVLSRSPTQPGSDKSVVTDFLSKVITLVDKFALNIYIPDDSNCLYPRDFKNLSPEQKMDKIFDKVHINYVLLHGMNRSTVDDRFSLRKDQQLIKSEITKIRESTNSILKNKLSNNNQSPPDKRESLELKNKFDILTKDFSVFKENQNNLISLIKNNTDKIEITSKNSSLIPPKENIDKDFPPIKLSSKSKPKKIQVNKPIYKITSSDPKASSDDILTRFKEAVKQTPAHIQKIFPQKNSLTIITESNDQVNLIKDNIATKNLSLSPIDRKNPQITIYNVPSDLEESDIIEDIFLKNILTMDKTTFLANFKIVKSYRSPTDIKQNTQSLICSCSPSLRNYFRQKDHIFISFSSCLVLDRIIPTRCFRCSSYHHSARFCKASHPFCSFCLENHSSQECKASRNANPGKYKGQNQCAACITAGLK
nr:PREDICTED: uncharacterized protein LOC109041810 [Bemisia tabaci]